MGEAEREAEGGVGKCADRLSRCVTKSPRYEGTIPAAHPTKSAQEAAAG